MSNLDQSPDDTQANWMDHTERLCKAGDPPHDAVAICAGTIPPRRIEGIRNDEIVCSMVVIGADWLLELANRMHARGPTELFEFLLGQALTTRRIGWLLNYWNPLTDKNGERLQ
jgi:hypothetical protein